MSASSLRTADIAALESPDPDGDPGVRDRHVIHPDGRRIGSPALTLEIPPGAVYTAVLRGLSARFYLPAFSIVTLAAALVAIGWLSHWGGSSFASAMTDLRVVVVGPATLAFLACCLVVERLRPAQRRPIFARGYRQDLLYTVLNATIVGPLVVALSLSFAEVARKALPWIVAPRVGFVPRWVVIALIFVGMDGCNWLAHLANHRIMVLWRFHELHHSQEDMSALTVFRTHPLIHVSYLIQLVPGIVLVANGAVPTAILVAYAAFLAFEHSNTNLGYGPLGRVFVSPNYHRIHHRLDGRQDVNLGFALSIWDQMAHRAVFPTKDTIRADTGLPGRPLLVEQAGDRPRHFRIMIAQLAGPFRPVRPGPGIESGDLEPNELGSYRDGPAPEDLVDRVSV